MATKTPSYQDISRHYDEALQECNDDLRVAFEYFEEGSWTKGIHHLMRANGALGTAYGLGNASGENPVADTTWKRLEERVQDCYEYWAKKVKGFDSKVP